MKGAHAALHVPVLVLSTAGASLGVFLQRQTCGRLLSFERDRVQPVADDRVIELNAQNRTRTSDAV